jgi:hypothetical protein
LKQRGWQTVLDTGQSVILGRAPVSLARHAIPASSGPDIFPWP